jgi:hypothetical protein
MVSHPSTSTLFPRCSITDIFGNCLNEIDHRFKKHIWIWATVFIGSLWLCRNNEVFNDKNSSILYVIYRVSVLSIYGHLYRGWRIETRLQRFVHGWRLHLTKDIFSNMAGHIAYASVLQFRRDYNWSLWYVIFPFYLCGWYWILAMCILVMQSLGVSLILLSNKTLFIKEKNQLMFWQNWKVAWKNMLLKYQG